MDTNGYVSFGPNFGGLIIQWGIGAFKDAGIVLCPLPIACSSVLAAWAIDDVETNNAIVIGWVTSRTTGKMAAFSCNGEANKFVYIAICI